LFCVPESAAFTISDNVVVITSLQNVFVDLFPYISLVVIIVFRSYYTFVIADDMPQVRLACF
jgi:hypothetical protein